jgi:hypothetical protein
MIVRKRKATQHMASPYGELDAMKKKRKAIPINDMDDEKKFEVYLEDYDAAVNFLDNAVDYNSNYDPSDEECTVVMAAAVYEVEPIICKFLYLYHFTFYCFTL